MEAVTITLDGREVSGQPGMTILQLAQESGADIPTLCHHPYLPSTGACRLCLVEDESSGALLVSCITAIQPGMVISTHSDRVLERRKVIIELMLASHPDACPVCSKGNRCQLREIASSMGIGLLRFEKIRMGAAIEEVNPFIVRDLSKCILCARCIRADQELVVEGAIDYVDRGFAVRPATLNRVPLELSECTFCGTCVAICPTGALMERETPYTGTTARSVSTICPFCGCGCKVDLEIKDNVVVRARPAGDSPVNRGTLCVRGSYGYDFIHSPERLTTPLIKGEDGGLEPASWEEAFGQVARAFKRIKAAEGPNSLGVICSTKCTNEENYLLQRFARCVLGTNNVDNGGRLYDAASRAGLGWTLGYPSSIGTLGDLEAAEVILVVGADLPASAPAVGYAVKRAVRHHNAKLILTEPLGSGLAPFADCRLQLRPGTEVALLNGLAKVIIDERLLDEEFVARRTNDFELLSDSLKSYGLDFVTSECGLSAEAVRTAASLLGNASSAAIVYGNGVTQSARGTATVMALANLALLTGNIGRKGSGVYALEKDSNALGASDMGTLPDFLPGYSSLKDEEARKKFEELWGTPPPSSDGLTAVEMVAQAGTGRIKGMYIVGENPVLSFPDPASVRRALASLDFLVVQDIFLTETAALADVVLPAASFAEKEGTFTNFEGRVQYLAKAVDPPGDARPDWEIVLQLAQEMDAPLPFSSLEDIAREIEETVPFYEGPGGSALDRSAPGPPGAEGAPWSARRLYMRQFPSGFGRFASVQYTAPPDPPEDYPMTLLSGSVLYHFGTGSRSSRSRRLAAFNPPPFAEVSRVDADTLGIQEGEEVRITSPNGELVATARVSRSIPAGLVFVPYSSPQAPLSGLFTGERDPTSQTPCLKSCSVRMERNNSRG